MGLFTPKKKRTEEVRVPEKETACSSLSSGQSIEGKKACLTRLDSLFNDPSSKGTVLKLYLENFKNLNNTFG